MQQTHKKQKRIFRSKQIEIYVHYEQFLRGHNLINRQYFPPYRPIMVDSYNVK